MGICHVSGGRNITSVIRLAANSLYQASARDLITLPPKDTLFVHTIQMIFRATELLHRLCPHSRPSFMVICFSGLVTSESTLDCDSTPLIWIDDATSLTHEWLWGPARMTEKTKTSIRVICKQPSKQQVCACSHQPRACKLRT